MDRVLIVEDDKEIARIIRYYLSQDNLYEVVSAASAEEALFSARRLRYYSAGRRTSGSERDRPLRAAAAMARLPDPVYQLPG